MTVHTLSQPIVTLGAPVLGTIIIALVVTRWWTKSSGAGKGGDSSRSWRALLPFVLALCLGMLAVLASAGWSALGVITRLGLWGGNGLGYAYLVWGVGGTSPTVTRPGAVILTPGGYAVYAIWLAVAIGRSVWTKRLAKRQAWLGMFAGVCLGMSSGIAGVAAVPIASAVNLVGSWYTGVIQ